MMAMYNPQNAEYTDELSVRHEISRVFDACFSCQKCVDTCGVFPELVSAVGKSPHTDASFLTPEQQDTIVEGCHMCMQCVVQCPFSELPSLVDISPSAVRFPELVIRHRTMLWSQGDLTVRQRWVLRLVGYWPFVMHRLSLLRRFSFFRQVMYFVLSKYVALPLMNGGRSVARRVRHSHSHTHSGDVVVFPTCVVTESDPQLIKDFFDASDALQIKCSDVRSLVCCGAPSLYAGDMKRFRRVAKRNISRLSRLLKNESTVVVGQPVCLGVMKQFYPVVAPSTTTNAVVNSLCGMTEFLVNKMEGGSLVDGSHHDESRLVIVQSSTEQFSHALSEDKDHPFDAQDMAAVVKDFLVHTTSPVDVVTYQSFGETLWSSENRFRDYLTAGADVLAQQLRDVDRASGFTVVGESRLAASHLGDLTGIEMIHPVSWLADKARGSVEPNHENKGLF
jgi:Fe-S oxidoreductase